MATPSYHLKVFHAIFALARCYAREDTKRAIRARGGKISAYVPKNIYRMADELLEQRWEEFSAKAKASEVIRELQEECEWKERLRLERKSKYLHKSQSVAPQGVTLCETHVQNGAVKPIGDLLGTMVQP